MNIVVVDSGRLAGEADFPEIDLQKYGWIQFPEIEPELLTEKCWRSDIIITVSTPITREVIDEAFKLKLIAVAGDDYEHVDMEAAQARGIQVCHTPGLAASDVTCTEQICAEVISNINAFIHGGEINRVPGSPSAA